MADTYTVNQKFDGFFRVSIQRFVSNGYVAMIPIVKDGVKWETSLDGSPGKLTFTVYKDKNGGLEFNEGDRAYLTFYPSGFNVSEDAQHLFVGKIFSKKRTKDGWIEVVAYDRLRYLKNKATTSYTNKKASTLITELAKKYAIPVGDIVDTGYIIGSRVEDNQNLLDIFQNALDLTLINTGRKYILYGHDDKLQLANASKLRTNVIIDKTVAKDYDYKSSIDDETYNEVILYYDDNDKNKRTWFVAEDVNTQKQWGDLVLTEQIQTPSNAQNRANQMLKLYNRKTRTLTVKEAFGETSCRAGASVIVNLDVGDVVINNYMLIEKATHTFKANEYRMDLVLSDKGFSA